MQNFMMDHDIKKPCH